MISSLAEFNALADAMLENSPEDAAADSSALLDRYALIYFEDSIKKMYLALVYNMMLTTSTLFRFEETFATTKTSTLDQFEETFATKN